MYATYLSGIELQYAFSWNVIHWTSNVSLYEVQLIKMWLKDISSIWSGWISTRTSLSVIIIGIWKSKLFIRPQLTYLLPERWFEFLICTLKFCLWLRRSRMGGLKRLELRTEFFSVFDYVKSALLSGVFEDPIRMITFPTMSHTARQNSAKNATLYNNNNN